MAAPTTSIAWALVELIIGRLREDPALDGVVVEPGWPGDKHLGREMVWVDELESPSIAIPLMQAGRKQRDETVTIPLEFRVVGLATLDETMSRLAELMAVVEDMLAIDPELADDGGPLEGLIAAELTSRRQTAGQTPEGYLGFAELIVEARTRLE